MIVYVLAFLLSFCSISYQFIIARVLGQFSNDEVLSQSITLGFYLVAMGLGSQCVGFLKTKKEENLLFSLELSVAVLGILLVPFLYVSHITVTVFFSNWFQWMDEWSRHSDKVFLFQPATLVIGFFTGMELPLLIKLHERRGKPGFNRILGINYLGALAGSFAVSLFLLPRLDLIRGSVFIALINFLAALLLLWGYRPYWRRALKAVLACCLFFGVCYETLRYSEVIQQVYMKAHYLETRMLEFSWTSIKNLVLSNYAFNDIERYVTPYQIIDIVPRRFMISGEVPGDFSLYLNMQPQFSEGTQRPYHEGMAEGGINLAGFVPHHVLVLGAGDGLLVAELLKRPEIEKITLVELDPFMIELAKKYVDIKEMNKASLYDPRVEVVIDDAFHFVRKSKQKYDGVFVDFPFPVSYELGKLFSVEFYTSLQRVLSPEGFFVADIPVWRTIEKHPALPRPYPQEIILSTMKAAGLRHILIYGPFEPFVFVSLKERPLVFDYGKFPSWLSTKTLVNMTALKTVQEQADIKPENINSIFKPKRFRW